MGFATSGAAAVLAVGLLVCAGILFPVLDETTDRTLGAAERAEDRLLRTQNTDVAVESATYDTATATLVVDLGNTGTTSLSASATDLLIDGRYRPATQTVVRNETTVTDPAVWLPGETLRLSAVTTPAPNRVVVVTETGRSVAAVPEVR
jgi:flagellar protein FlaF